jgi:signal transduction histidine kinase
MARRTLLITYIATYLLAIATIIRLLVRFRDDRFWLIALLLGYLILLVAEPFFIRRNHLLTTIYLIVQIAIIGTVALITPSVDFFAILFCPLVVQVMHNFPQRTGFLITGIFTVITSILLLLGLGPEEGLPLIFIYGVIYFLLAAFIAIIREAEAARQEAEVARKEAEAAREVSQKQQADLQSAHRQLQSYTAQAEELAVLEDRNQLARNLHDSVTQTIFSMRLTAEAANMLLDQNSGRVGSELDRLQTLAKSALGEMRSLIFELRPTAVTELGLIPALRHHIMTLERQYGLIVDLQVSGEPHLSELEAQRLFRISQEALNNVVKHSQTEKACLTLRFDASRIYLLVEDQGLGFDPETFDTAEDHMGLAGLQERVDAMGGLLTIDSQPGQGTRVKVEVTSTSGKGNNG